MSDPGSMNIALVGDAPDAAELVRELASRFALHLVGTYGVRSAKDGGWEALLATSAVDVVIVAPPARRGEHDDLLRKLVQARVPVLAMQPACESIVAFELEMIRQDTDSPLVPFVAGAEHPALARVASLLAGDGDSPIGRVEQLLFERTIHDRSRDQVLAHLARDVAIVRRLVGPIRRVSALGSSGRSRRVQQTDSQATPNEDACSDLMVSMSGESTRVTWSVGPVDNRPLGRLTLVGSLGKATLTMPQGEATWNLSLPEANPQSPSSLPRGATVGRESSDEAARVQELLTRISGKLEPAGDRPRDHWLDACRDLEVVDYVEQSLTRGRTLEIQTDPPSEEGTFKGVMAAGSCLLLMFALLVLIVGSAIDGLLIPTRRAAPSAGARPSSSEDSREDHPARSLWIRLWPAYPFLFFLLLQLLRLATRPTRRDSVPGLVAWDSSPEPRNEERHG